MGHASTRTALVYLHAREEQGQSIADGMNAMVRKAQKKEAEGAEVAREPRGGPGAKHAGRGVGLHPTRKGE